METETITIEGGNYITGEVTLSESVMAAKYALIAGILSKGPTVITNPPDCKALGQTTEILAFIGAEILTEEGLSIDGKSISTLAIPQNNSVSKFELVVIWAMLLARFGKAGIPETIIATHAHIRTILEAFGVTVDLESHYVVAYSPKRSEDLVITLPLSIPFEERVLSSIVALTLATLGATTTIRQCVPSEEFDILRDIFTLMGVTIEGDYPEIVVHGVPELVGISYVVPPSSREALLYLSLVTVSQGDVRITNFPKRSLSRITKRLLDRGVEYSIDNEELRVWQTEHLFSPSLQTLEESQKLSHLWQSVLAVISSLSQGESQIFVPKNKGQEIVSILSACGVETTLLSYDDFMVDVRIFGPHKLLPTTFNVSSYESGVIALLCAQSAHGTSSITHSEFISDTHQNIYSKLTKLGMKIYGYNE